MKHKMMTMLLASVAMIAACYGAEGNRPRRRASKPTGGYLLKESGKCVSIKDKQKVYTSAELDAVMQRLRRYSQFPVYCNATESKESAVTIELVDGLDMPGLTVMTAPEQGWARLGVSWLVADNPSGETKERRLYVELMRTIGMAMGVGVSMYQPCMMRSVSGVRDLDAIKTDKPSPEGCENFASCAKRFGLGEYRYYTYRLACAQGWAPPPTNDIQRAIWDEVHTLPTKPLPLVKPTK